MKPHIRHAKDHLWLVKSDGIIYLGLSFKHACELARKLIWEKS